MKTPIRWFWLAVALQVLLLLGMVGRHAYTVQTGVPVILKTAPVDPWDYLRGEYVRLNYDISRLRPESVPMEGLPYRSGQAVWVTLRPGTPYFSAAAVSIKRPATSAGEVAVQATVEWFNEIPEIPPDQPSRFPDGEIQLTFPRLGLRYGIEQFYVPEGEGPGLERRQGEMTVEALVDRFGRIALSRVFLDGKQITWR